MDRSRTGLDSLFDPRSIAVIGASADPRKISGRPIAHLKARFSGRVYPVNPGRSEVQGLRAYARLPDIEGPVDQAIVALPADHVQTAVEDAIRKGVSSIVVLSAGFAEAGEAGAAAQSALVARCRQAGVRLLGPNCLGLANFFTGAYSTFSHSLEFAQPAPGPVAIVSQSGAVATYALVKGARRGIGFSCFAATGNEADVDVADCIEWLAGDARTGVILAYLESCRDGRRLAAALEAARRAAKPVIVFKAGASAAGGRAAASHTGALAGEDAIFDAVFRAAGAIRVDNFDDMLDIAYAASLGMRPKGTRLGVASVSGGFGVMIADKAEEAGLDLPPLSAAAQEEIRTILPLASPRNPVDCTPQVLHDFSIFSRLLGVLVEETSFDAIVVFLGTMGLDDALAGPLTDAILDAKRQSRGRVFCVCAMASDEVRRRLEGRGIPVFEDPDRLIAALAALEKAERAFARPAARSPRIGAARSSRIGAAGALPARLDEAAARQVLSAAGISFAPLRQARSREEAEAAGRAFGAPLAVKINSAEIAHKSDIGGVMLDVLPEEAGAAFDTVLRQARQAVAAEAMDGVVISPMLRGGVETVMGASIDPQFGPVVMFGMGGVHVEFLKDVTFRLAPIVEAEALEMIRDIRGFGLLTGARGAKASDLGALARALVSLSQFIAAHAETIESVDINPFIALPEGGMAVDALIVPRRAGTVKEIA